MINDGTIEQVMKIYYLGTSLRSTNRADEVIEHQMMKVRRNAGCTLYRIINNLLKKPKLGFTKVQYIQ